MPSPGIKELEEAGKLIIHGNYQKALDLLLDIGNNKKISNQDKLASQVLKSEVYNKIGNFTEALKISNQVLGNKKDIDNQLILIDALIQKNEALWRLDNHKEHLEVLEESEKLLSDLESELPQEEYANRKALLSYHSMVTPFNTGKYEEAHNKTLEGLEYAEKSDNQLTNIWLNYSVANTAYFLDKSDITKRHIRIGHKLAKKIDNKQEIAFGNHLLAMIYANEGNLQKAIDLRKEALSLNEAIGATRDISDIYIDLGIHYREIYDLDLAIDCFQKFFEISGEDSLLAHIPLINIAYTYQLKGELEKAFSYYEKTIKKCEKIGERTRILPKTLYSLVNLSIDESNIEKAKEYLQKLKEISQGVNNTYTNVLTSIASAQILKESNRMHNWSKAILLLEKNLEKKDISNYWRVITLLELSELLLKELHLTGEKQVLEEIKKKITSVILIAKKNDFHIILAEGYWLLSQLALAELDADKAKEYLVMSSNISKDKGLIKLANDISKKQQQLEKQIIEWQRFIDQEKPLVETLKHLSLFNGIHQIAREASIELADRTDDKEVRHKKIFDFKI